MNNNTKIEAMSPTARASHEKQLQNKTQTTIALPKNQNQTMTETAISSHNNNIKIEALSKAKNVPQTTPIINKKRLLHKE